MTINKIYEHQYIIKKLNCYSELMAHAQSVLGGVSDFALYTISDKQATYIQAYKNPIVLCLIVSCFRVFRDIYLHGIKISSNKTKRETNPEVSNSSVNIPFLDV